MSHIAEGTQNLRVEGTVLKASVPNEAGELHDAEINLNTVLGNNDGHFEWDGTDFGASAENITFSVEGEANAPVLRAHLKAIDGTNREADVNLAERLIHQNGAFQLK